MFWESVGSGLEVLAYWQTYLAGLLFLALYMGPTFLIGVIVIKSDRNAGGAGFSFILISSLFHTFALVIFVLTMSPIILGLFDDAVWSFPWSFAAERPWSITKLVAKLLLTSVFLAFVPIIGRLQSLHTLILGGLTLAVAVGMIKAGNPVLATKAVHIWPGFWFATGLLVIGLIVAWLGEMLATFLAAIIEAKIGEGTGRLFILPIAAIFGFVPLFMYGAWLGAQLRV